MVAVLADDGSITIPREVWESLGISAGARLDFSVQDGKIVLNRVDDDPVSRVVGCLKSDLSSDEIMAYIRGPM